LQTPSMASHSFRTIDVLLQSSGGSSRSSKQSDGAPSSIVGWASSPAARVRWLAMPADRADTMRFLGSYDVVHDARTGPVVAACAPLLATSMRLGARYAVCEAEAAAVATVLPDLAATPAGVDRITMMG
jgi:hypothetical protein